MGEYDNYIEYGSNGDNVGFFDLESIESIISDYIRSDYKNIRFYDPTTNKVFKHYYFYNNYEGSINRFLLFELPYEYIKIGQTMEIQIIIMPENQIHEYDEFKHLMPGWMGGNIKEFLPEAIIGNGYWEKVNNKYVYKFDSEFQSKEAEFTFKGLNLTGLKEVKKINVGFNRQKTGGYDKRDFELKLIINGEESLNKADISRTHLSNETVVYGGSLDSYWGLNIDEEEIDEIKLIYKVTGDNKDSSCTTTISDLSFQIYYDSYEFDEYPIFSRHQSITKNPYYYNKIETIDNKRTWMADVYPIENGAKKPLKARISKKLDNLPSNINLYTKHKYNQSSSMNTEHIIGIISEDSSNTSMTLGIVDNLGMMIDAENEETERLIIYDNIKDKTKSLSLNKHSGNNIDKYFEYCIKYSPEQVIVQSKDTGITKTRNKKEI